MSFSGVVARMPPVADPVAEWSSTEPPLSGDGFRFIGSGRVDNRHELARDLGLPESSLTDVGCMLAAHRRWGNEAPSRIRGDWAFAAWDAASRTLVLARDHFGNTALYYYADTKVFAFSTSRTALLAYQVVPVEIDELYLVRHLASLNTHGEETAHLGVKRLPPAHLLTVTSGRVSMSRYWRLEETPVVSRYQRATYAGLLADAVDRAVRVQLRGVAVPAATLSGGLDSGSVAAFAARSLREEGRRLLALSTAPLPRADGSKPGGFDSDLRYAEATARFAGNVDLVPIDAAHVGPVAAARRVVELVDQPIHAAANAFWLLALFEAAQAEGAVLLTGQQGNGGMSWTGSLASQPLPYRLRTSGRAFVRGRSAMALPDSIRRSRRMRRAEELWAVRSPISPDFMRQTDLSERFADSLPYRPQSALEERVRVLMPERSAVGDVWAELGDAFGVDVRDPTADVDLLTLSFSIPDEVFIDRREKLDRWPIREATRGLLPEEVRLNRQRFRQAPDLVWRLRCESDGVNATLAELEDGRAADYLDVARMRRVWDGVKSAETDETRRDAALVLMRGIMAGVWVNGQRERTGANAETWLAARAAARGRGRDRGSEAGGDS